MNATAKHIVAALKDAPLTADELSHAVSYIEFSDHDVCERIIFKTKTALKNVYYLKADEQKALRLYVRVNWGTIKKMLLNGESGVFPPTLAKHINKYIDNIISSFEADIDSLQGEIEDIGVKIQEYEDIKNMR